jgi:ribosomal protein L15E
MALKPFFVNDETGRKFEVIKLDKEKGEITLKGEYANFVEPYDKDRFLRLGYKMVKVDVPDQQPEDDNDA